MISHRTIMTNAATAVKNSASILAACRSAFGCGLAIQVGAYATGIPGVKEAPFLWLYADGDNDEVARDETFVMHAVVGGCILGASGEKVVQTVVAERTDNANGLTVNGGNKTVEDLRDEIIAVIRAAACGAPVVRVTRTENDLSHFPLEWAEFEVEFMNPGTID